MAIKVLIIGAGPAGLTLANALKNKGIGFKLFERDSEPNRRQQGWSFGFNRGIDALRSCIPAHRFETFEAEVSTDPENIKGYSTMSIFDGVGGQEILNFGAPEFESYRVNRQRFRKWLLKDIQEDVVWNKQAKSFEETKEDVSVTFGDGSVERGDFLVVADGTMSKLAQQHLKSPPEINPLVLYGLTRWISEEEYTKIAFTKTQSTLVIGRTGKDGVVMFITLNDIDRSRKEAPFQIFFSISRYGSERVKAPVVENIKKWASGFEKSPAHQELLQSTPNDSDIKEIFVRERKPEHELLLTKENRVVFAGDAAHPMTMFRGNGANQAIIDASVLANEISQLASNAKSLNLVVTDYNSEMVPRCQKAVSESHETAEMMHNRPEEIYEAFRYLTNVSK